ncbi:Phosphoglycolate phosphatase [Candidatus Magnetaquicoccaceae bacterium FCR-1]|uniref:Phosphoglycolate phosphatase n=1 Tax=Candidatus Magnetaquiglobus chichijimensis TaxID=3141448 RepID=A0ABQ0C857_9PROT
MNTQAQRATSVRVAPDHLRIANRMLVPATTRAILWDMDGVLIDSLGLDFKICNQLIEAHFGPGKSIDDPFIQSIFALHPPAFWEKIFAELATRHGVRADEATRAGILARYEEARVTTPFELLPGIAEILAEARRLGLRMAVVSNNTGNDVRAILERSGILAPFDLTVGNDLEGFRKKPAPDGYLHAARLLGVAPDQAVVVEDSLLGLEAGHAAGCHTIAVATGGTPFEVLAASGLARQVQSAFTPLELVVAGGDIRAKRILTPNDFVSHMVEHIAWRLGVAICLDWNNDLWFELGRLLGVELALLPRRNAQAAALGMIDDGSAEILIDWNSADHGAEFLSGGGVDTGWFLALRCEQAASGRPMWELMNGLALGLGARIQVRLCSAEDPHHAWEGIYRTLGIALRRVIEPPVVPVVALPDAPAAKPVESRFTLEEKTANHCRAIRVTAESALSLSVDFTRVGEHRFRFEVADSIRVDGFPALLALLADRAGFSLQVECRALALSSSHVVLEDTALVLGRVLFEILKIRMEESGVNGAGSSVRAPEDLHAPIRVGISVEGRKFLSLVPLAGDHAALREGFLIGREVAGGIRSEDLDDFLDGLVGGMSASLMIHFATIPDPEAGWPMIFAQLGRALEEAFAPNPQRKGMPPGVKATLL